LPQGVVKAYNRYYVNLATGLGWLVFGDLPDLYTITGLCVILAAGLTSASLRR